MEILLAFIAGASVGTALHFLQRGRESRGVALAPMLGAAVSGLAWLALTWAGLTTGNPWIWVAAVVVPAVVVPLVLAIAARRRTAHDASERLRLKIA